MIEIIEVPELAQLARCRPGKTILIRPHVTPQEFADYFEGKAGGASAHKKEVLAELENLGWPLSRILSIVTTPEKVRRFLLLHEASHIRHGDCRIAKPIPEKTRTAVEVRACLEALIQMGFESALSNPTHNRQNRPTPCNHTSPKRFAFAP